MSCSSCSTRILHQRTQSPWNPSDMDGMCIVYAPNFDEAFIMSLLSSLIVTSWTQNISIYHLMLDRDWCREHPFPRHSPKKNWGP